MEDVERALKVSCAGLANDIMAELKALRGGNAAPSGPSATPRKYFKTRCQPTERMSDRRHAARAIRRQGSLYRRENLGCSSMMHHNFSSALQLQRERKKRTCLAH